MTIGPRLLQVAALGCFMGWGWGASAETSPVPGYRDARIGTVVYDPDQVVRLPGRIGLQTTIEFGPDERVETVSLGDNSVWQAAPNKAGTLLFIKALEPGAVSDMTVSTERHRYAFLLSASKRASSPFIVVRFRYPANLGDPAGAKPSANTQGVKADEPERRNSAYRFDGATANVPESVFDDGRFTYFKFRKGAAAPALFVVGADGTEAMANYAFRSGYLIVEELAPQFVLRSGKLVTRIHNLAWREPALGSNAPVRSTGARNLKGWSGS